MSWLHGLHIIRREMLIGAFKPLFQVDCSDCIDGHGLGYTICVLRTFVLFVLFVTVCLGHLILYLFIKAIMMQG